MDEALKKVLVEARARVIWGRPIAEIKGWLKEQGLSDGQIDGVMRTCLHERAGAVRMTGIRDIIIGASAAILGISVIFLSPDTGRRFIQIRIFATLGGIYGLCRVFRGAGRLIGGARVRGSLTEL